MAITDPAPTWPIEPTNWFIVLYYANNATNTSPTSIKLVMTNYEDAIAYAKATILAAGNTGVCAISQVTGTIVYPSIPWVAF